MRRLMIGVGYRKPLAHWIESRPSQVACLEITAEHFFDGGLDQVQHLAEHYALFVHGLGLSLGSPGPLDPTTLARFARVVEAAKPLWISEHVAFTRTAEIDLGHLNPIASTRESLAVLADHARELAERCGRPLILENITSHLRLPGEMSEMEFLNRLCERSGCGLLLDVTNLYINSLNHAFDPLRWLHEIDPRHIVQLHIVGYAEGRDGFKDTHACPIQDDLLALATEVVRYASVKAVIVERDDNFPPQEAMVEELQKLEAALGEH